MKDNLLPISDEDIEINFIIDGQEYVVLKSEHNDENIYLGKIVEVDDEYDTIVSVDDEDEYRRALAEYVSLVEYETEELDHENWL